MASPTLPAAPGPDRFLVHRSARAHPRPLPAAELAVAPPPTVGWGGSSVAGWLQYLVPLVGSVGSIVFLFAVPGQRPAWLVAVVIGAALASVGLGFGLRLVERRAARRARRRERARYLAHLDRVATEAAQLAAHQLAVAEYLHPDLPELWALVNRVERLWERRPADEDFLTVRIGRGPVGLAAPVRVDAGGGPLVEHDPELLEAAHDLAGQAGQLPDAPIPVPLRRLGLIAVTGPPEATRALARSLVCQLAAFHAPDDLRILAAFPPTALRGWEWLKWLPHARDPTPEPRWLPRARDPSPEPAGGPPSCLLAQTADQLAVLFELEVRPRLRGAGGPRPHLLAVLEMDPPGPGRSQPALLDELLERAATAGTTVVWLARDPAGEPSELAARVRFDEHGTATFEETAPGGRLIGGIRPDNGGLAFCEAIARRLAPLRLDRQPATAPPAGPIRLLELLCSGTVPTGPTSATSLTGPNGLTGLAGQGAPWPPSPRAGPRPRGASLQVPLGVQPGGEPLVLDLKEAAEGGAGPHGLVVGATGSGKSELLRTIVAGLAATHPPEQLAFVLVDFKGGAAFADLAGLPHVAGLITNLHADLSMVDRAMAALQGEQGRRQRLLGQAGNQPDLRAYTAAGAADPSREPLPSLLIVVDEFGELLTARPEFLELFTAIGRVGRSLGMHLLLASQRVDEGRLHGLDGHLRYRICLRTFSGADSAAVLGSADAYHLPPGPGAGLLKVDAGSPVRFTSALVSTSHPPPILDRRPTGADPFAPGAGRPPTGPGRLAHGAATVPPRILRFTATGPASPGAALATDLPAGEPPGGGGPTDLEALVAGLAATGRPVHQVWLPPLDAAIPLDQVLAATGRGWLRVPVGVVDRPAEQVKEPLVLDLSGAAGHLAVVGAPRTGKSTLLCTVVAAIAATHPPDAVQVYAIDLGGGLLHRLAGLPHVGAVCGNREPERVHRLVRELRSLLVERERRFRDLGVESMDDWHELRRAGLDHGGYGEVVLAVDNWGALVRELPELEAELVELAATGLHYGVHLVLAANRWAELRPALRDNLGGRLELRLNDPVESEVGRAAAGSLPELPGRGLTQSGLQFQAALPGPTELVLGRALADPGGAVAPPLRLLPALVGEGALPPPGPGQPAGLPFALEEHRLELVWLDLFQGSPHLLVLGDAECGKTSLLRLVARGLVARHPPEELAILVVDPRRGLLDLAGLPHLDSHASSPGAVAEAVGRLEGRLTRRLAAGAGIGAGAGGPSGSPAPTRPHQVVLVDDYDLLPATAGSPLGPLLDLLAQGRELGLHLVLARGVAGAARAAFEPVFQRLRELGGPGLIMSGDPHEGPLVGGHNAATLPPGRGLLIRRRQPPTLVQVAYSPPPPPAHGPPQPGTVDAGLRRAGPGTASNPADPLGARP